MNKCPYCESEKILSIDNYQWKGHKILSDVFKCDNCNEIHITSAAIKEIEEINRLVSGLLLPDDIKNTRKRIGKTQLEIAATLGIGLKTYLRWENGHVYQTKEHDNLLRQYFDNEICMIERRKSTSDWIETLASGTNPKFNFLLATHSKSKLNPEQNKKIRDILKNRE